MLTIHFEMHGYSIDNEKHLASGHYDSPLAPERVLQAEEELGRRYKDISIDAIFTSDLQRAYKAADVAFQSRSPLFKDMRLRECAYGDFTRYTSEEV